MPFLNLNFGFMIYEDIDNSKNPDIRIPDISENIEGVTVDYDKSERFAVYPNEIKDVATTQRSVLWDSSTELQFYRPITGVDTFRMQYTGTGTAPVFKVNRSIAGAADTEITISRVNDYVARIQNTGGTAWNLASVQVNDFIRFEKDTDALTSPFVENNRDREYLIQNVGVDFIDFVDNGAQADETGTVLGAGFETVLKALSQGPVKTGDVVQVSGSGINPSNQGKFEILDLTDEYIEFANPLGVDETKLYGSNSIVVYEYLIGFVNIRATGPIKVRFGSQTEWIQLNRLGSKTIFMGSVCTHKIEAFNDGASSVSVSVQHSMVTG